VNYRHAFHAGNFADLIKHSALIHILLYLQKKDTPFAVLDSHAARGLYDLTSDEARRTGEAQLGIGCVRGTQGREAWRRYLDIEADPSAYQGSPLIAAKLLRPQDRLVAFEKHPDEFALLKHHLAPFRKARAVEGDGYAGLLAALPPPERRGVILMDPPFEAPDEFEAAAAAVKGALRRFATGIFLIWYPVKSPAAVRAFCGEVLSADVKKALTIEIGIDAPPGRLARAGLLVLNPPFGFDGAMREILALITLHLPGGTGSLDWLREN
jgi:23S rRNA (adenine2030-N6)-methyltransferase